MTDFDLWKKDGAAFCWIMPAAPWWKRLPVIRHIRASWASVQVSRDNAFLRSVGKIPSGYDSWVVYGIAKGMEKPHD